MFVGNVVGYTLVKSVPFFGKRLPQAKVKRLQRYSFWGPLILLSYHGYKASAMLKRRGLRQLTKDPNNIIQEQKE